MGCLPLRPRSMALLSFAVAALLHAESIDDAMEGFDDTPAEVVSQSDSKTASDDTLMEGFDDDTPTTSNKTEEDALSGFDDSGSGEGSDVVDETESDTQSKEEDDTSFLIDGLTGKLTQQFALSYNDNKPKNIFSSLRNTLFLDYEHRFENGAKVKVNVRGFYDGMYDVRKRDYTAQERDSLRTEVEIFDAYLEWSVNDSLDVKAGRQVVVWGRSDTIRITDILNPLDNRRPGIVDIEDLRLPVTMLRFDYSVGDWRITPIAILEQRFSKNPPYGSVYNPLPADVENGQLLPYPPKNEHYNDVTFALSAGAEYHGWDINLYAAHVYDDNGYIKNPNPFVTPTLIYHEKSTMFGTALNVLSGSWLFKTEAAYWRDLRYTFTPQKKMSRIDGLAGVEYTGIADTIISYDFAIRHFISYDPRLKQENLEENTYQHAFRISSNFVNDTVHLNYLHTRFGLGFENGGFQRAWVKYDIADAINTEVGFVDYFGGTPLFDEVKDEVLVFMDISYNF